MTLRRPALATSSFVEHLARCRAVCFPPFEEDYGFVTVEAFASRKAVITCRDSGGPAELVEDGVNGFVCEPTPAALARALRARDRRRDARRERMGDGGTRRRAATAELGRTTVRAR